MTTIGLVCFSPGCQNIALPSSPCCEFHVASAKGNAHNVGVHARVAGRCVIAGNGCWEYGRTDPKTGYPLLVSTQEGPKRAYAALKRAVDPPADPSLECDHLCRNRACCNPQHIAWVTRTENLARRPRMARTPEERRERWATYMREYYAKNPEKVRKINRESYRRRKLRERAA